jgi:hypothetical protein
MFTLWKLQILLVVKKSDILDPLIHYKNLAKNLYWKLLLKKSITIKR